MSDTFRGFTGRKSHSCLQRCLALCGLGLLALVSACATSPKQPEAPPAVQVPTEFIPATYYARVLADTGNNTTLFSPDTFAIWVTDEVVELKKQDALKAGGTIDVYTEQTARRIGENFYVFECHTESVFADSSIAYDVVGLRNVNAYLLLADGTKVPPLQRIIDDSVDEEQRGALTLFRRANILVFPKADQFTGTPTIPPASPAVRLVLDGHGSTFFFQWTAKPIPIEEPAPDAPPVPEVQKRSAIKVGYDALMAKFRALIRIID